MMKLGIVIPQDPHFDIIQDIIKKEFPDITPSFFYYKDYKDSAVLLQNKQSELDGILFSGSAPYDYANHYLEPKIIWDYLDRYSGSLLRAILHAALQGYDIDRISYDYYDLDSLRDIYAEQGRDLSQIPTLSYHHIKERGLNIEKYNEAAYQFHKENWCSGKASCIVTPCYAAANWLKGDGIPVIFAYPTLDVCRETISRLRAEYIAKKNQKSQIVILSIEVDLPNEYSMFAQNERMYMQDRMAISSYIYAFSEKLDATVVEATYRNFLLFTTRNILESVTNNLKSFDLLNQVSEHYLSFISIGIGYGETVKAAKENANSGLLQAKRYGQNAAFVVYADKIPRGPLGLSKEKIIKPADKAINERISLISSRSEVSMQNIFKLYNIVISGKRNTFTVRDLAESMHITERSVNRMINKLELSGYAEIVGKQSAYNIGRPSRIVRIDFKLQ